MSGKKMNLNEGCKRATAGTLEEIREENNRYVEDSKEGQLIQLALTRSHVAFLLRLLAERAEEIRKLADHHAS